MTAAVLNKNYKITSVVDANNYVITTAVTATAGDTGNGGTVYAAYEVPAGAAAEIPLSGWGSGFWGSGSWGFSASSVNPLRLWSQSNFGQDLLYGYRGGPIYYWNAALTVLGQSASITIASPGVVTTASLAFNNGDALTLTTTGKATHGPRSGAAVLCGELHRHFLQPCFDTRGTPIVTSGTQSGDHRVSPRGTALMDFSTANQVPTIQNFLLVSDASRFVFAFGANQIYSACQDPMLVRWSDQENPFEWEPLATNQAGSVRLSHGSQIVNAIQTRQEIVVFTDTSVYSLQYLGPPYVWAPRSRGDNISIMSQNAAALAGNVVYWMGSDRILTCMTAQSKRFVATCASTSIRTSTCCDPARYFLAPAKGLTKSGGSTALRAVTPSTSRAPAQLLGRRVGVWHDGSYCVVGFGHQQCTDCRDLQQQHRQP